MRNIKIILSVISIFILELTVLNSYSQSWQWAKSGGGSATDHGVSVCQDSNGNIYVAGKYYDSPIPSSYGTFDTVTVPYIGASQIFLVKYSYSGSSLWAKSIGGNDIQSSYPEQPYKVFYDTFSDAIYLSGNYNDTIILAEDTLSGSGTFISKISTGGDFIWSKKLNVTWAYASVSDNSGNIYLCGNCSTATTIDTFSVSSGFFLAKFNSSGNCIKINTNLKDCRPGNISIINENLFFSGTTLNDTIQLDTLLRIFSYSQNAFVAKFNNDLNLNWACFATSTNLSDPIDLCIDSVCNSYVVGVFRTDIDFGDTSFTGYQWGDLFIAKYDSNGVFLWAKQGHNTTGGVYPAFCKTLNNGDLYIAGAYDGTDLKLGNYTVSSTYIARYNSSGNCLNVVTIPGNYQCEGLAVGEDNSFSIIGYFLGSLNIGGYNVTSHGFGDVYVAKHDMITGEELKILNTGNQLVIYANPNAGKCTITIPEEFKNETKLTLQIFDNKGNLLQQTPVEMKHDKISVNIVAEAKGIYNAVLGNGKKSYFGKIIFE